MDTRGGLDDAVIDGGLVSRRTINLGAAWSVPVILGAVAAPAATGSSATTDPTATLGVIIAVKGKANNGNRQVAFNLSFVNIVGTNLVVITSVSGSSWTTLPTVAATVDAQHPSASFLLVRPDNNSSISVTVGYTVNGVAQTPVAVTILNQNP